jgi:Family of unknown function (DUF5670)
VPAGQLGRFLEPVRFIVLFLKGKNMLWTIGLILLVLWALGVFTSYTMGGLVHILLVLAVVAVLVHMIQGRNLFS